MSIEDYIRLMYRFGNGILNPSTSLSPKVHRSDDLEMPCQACRQESRFGGFPRMELSQTGVGRLASRLTSVALVKLVEELCSMAGFSAFRRIDGSG